MRHIPLNLLIIFGIFFVVYALFEIWSPMTPIPIWGNLGFLLLGVFLCILRIRLLGKNRSTSSSKLPLVICIPLLFAADTTLAQDAFLTAENIPVVSKSNYPYVITDSVVVSIQSPDWIGDTLCMIQVRFGATSQSIEVIASFTTRSLKEKLLSISQWNTFPHYALARLMSTHEKMPLKLDPRYDPKLHYEIFAIEL